MGHSEIEGRQMIGRRSPHLEEKTEKLKGFDDFELRLGDILRGERATLGKSLLDVQRELKIKAAYVSAIENADPSGFDTPGFIAGYVRSYARYLGLDPEWAFKTFCEESNFQSVHGMSAQASSASTRKIRTVDHSRITAQGRELFTNSKTAFIPSGDGFLSRIEPGAIGLIMVLLALIGGMGYGGWFVLQEVQKVQFAPVEQTPGVVSDIDPLFGGDAFLADETDVAGFVPPAADALDRLYRPKALDVPVLVARDGPIAALDPRSFGALAPGLPVVLATQVPVVEFAPMAASIEEAIQVVAEAAPEVVLFAVRPAWVRIRSADGSILFEKILDAGEEYRLPQTEETPLLRAGNSGSVYFSVNGKTFGPAGQGTSVAKQVALSAEALTENYNLADLGDDADLARIVAQATP